MRLVHSLALVALAGSSAAQGSVWVVDDDGGAGIDFTSIAAGIAGAQAGDTLLVKSGDYAAFDLSKGLIVHADAGATVIVDGDVARVGDVLSGSVVVRGLDFASGMLIEDSVVPILFESCSFSVGYPQGLAFNPKPAVQVRDSSDVAFVRATVASEQMVLDFLQVAHPGTTGMEIEASDVAVYGSSIFGGKGVDAFSSFSAPNSPGGAGIELVSGSLLIQGSSVTGGPGGNGDMFGLTCASLFWQPEAGGTGLVVDSGSAYYLDSTFEGGPGGVLPICGSEVGPPGDATEIFAGTLTDLDFAARSLSANSPVRPGELLNIEIQAEDGDYVWLLLSLTPIQSFLETLAGTVFVGDPVTPVPLGVQVGAGPIVLPLNAPSLVGVDFVQVFFQALAYENSPKFVLGAPSAVTLLASSF